MTKRSNRLLALASVVLLAAPLAACTSGKAGNSAPIDIEMPFSTATPAPTGSLSGGPASPSPSADASPSVPPDASAAPESSATPRPTSSIDASTITGNENIEDEKKLTYAEYRALNSDVVGWIKIKDTNVDYPIVQSHDNEEYLTLTPTLVESKAGSLFVDSHASLSGQYASSMGIT